MILFLLLGAIIEEVTGGVYRDYVTENILSPLQMNRSTFNIDELRQTVNVSTPYIYDSEKEQLRPVQWPQLGNYEVGGGICSTVIDLMKYGQFYLNEYPQTLELSILMQKE